LLDDGTTPAAARLSTLDKIEVSEWLEPDGFSIDCAAQQVLKANVRFGSKADIARCQAVSALPPKADIVECDRHSQNKGDVKIKTPSGTLVIRG
jgi:hypothetical protein